MEVLKVTVDKETNLITITFSPEEILGVKKFIKELISDDNQNQNCSEPVYNKFCEACSCNPCMCVGTGDGQNYDNTMYTTSTADIPKENWESPGV